MESCPKEEACRILGKWSWVRKMNDRTLFSRTLESCLIREIIPKWPHKFRLVKYDNLPRLIWFCLFAHLRFSGFMLHAGLPRCSRHREAILERLKEWPPMAFVSYRLSPNQRWSPRWSQNLVSDFGVQNSWRWQWRKERHDFQRQVPSNSPIFLLFYARKICYKLHCVCFLQIFSL